MTVAEYIERTEELILAVNAGARAIENTKRYHGTVYTKDVFSESPQEIPYLQAAKVLREVSDAPAADVAPVVCGRWVHLGGDEWCCSACGFVITTEGSWDKPAKKYCEDCGHRVYAYYCEDRLFLAECECCEKKVLVKASNPNEAASKAFWGMEADYGE